MSDLSGQTLGKYRIVERLGRGGMADVYTGYQPGLDRYVAVKVLHSHLSEDPDFITRFKREARSVAELRHPHIVQVFDFDVQGENYYMVMEHIEGGKTLKQMLQELAARGERLPVEGTLDIMTKLADALAYAHGLGMVHRDIKPANVLIPTLNRPVLSDFGIARLLGETGLTSSGAMIGTPAYMSPEQGKGERGDIRSDIYALGIVLYEMLTGRPPYDADTPYAVILKHINDPLVPPHSLVGSLPDTVERIVFKCLAKNPEDRFSSMTALRGALRSAQSELARQEAHGIGEAPSPAAEEALPMATRVVAEAETQAAQPDAAPAAKAETQRPRWLMPAIAAGAVVLIGAAILALSGRQPMPLDQGGAATARPTSPVVTSAVDALIAAGRSRLFEGDPEVALDLFEQALEAEPGSAEARVGRALVHLSRYEDWRAAAGDLEYAAQLTPDDPFLHYGLGLLHSRAEEYYDPEKASAEFKQAAATCGSESALCAAAYFERAQLRAWTLGDMEGALADMDSAIDRYPDPNTVDPLYASRADIRAASGDAPGAIQDLETAHEHSRYGEYLERASALSVRMEDYARALSYYDKLLSTEPGNPHYLVMRGYVEWRSGDSAGAMKTARRALDLPSRPLEAHYLMGLLLLDDEPQSALGELQIVSQLTDPDSLYQATFPFFTTEFGHEIFLDLARAAHAMGDAETALSYIDQSLARDDYWPDPYIERGAILAEQGSTDAARQNYLKAREIAADNPALQAHIEELLATVARGRITIATISPLSGGMAMLGVDVQRAGALALEQMGGALRDMGFVVRLNGFDDQGRADVGEAIAGDIVDDPDTLCVVGPVLSGVALPASEQFHAAGLALISPSATATELTERGYAEVNRVVGRNDVQGVGGAGFAKSLGVASVHILFSDDAYGRGLAQVFRQTAIELGIKVTAFERTQAGEDFDRLLQAIGGAQPDMVFFATTVDQAGPFFRQAREQGYQGILMGPDGIDSPQLAALAGKALTDGGGMVYTTVAGPAALYPEASRFIQDFVDRFGAEPQPFAAQAYDATGICLSAILQAIETNAGELPTRAQVARAVRATQDYPGITGSLSFNRNGDLKTARYFAIRVRSADPDRWSENQVVQTLDIAAPNP